MAATSSIARSRTLHPSGRTHLPPPSLDAPQYLAPTFLPTPSPTPSLSSSSAAASPPPSIITSQLASGASNVSLFLGSLRLLEMDQLPDWPDITPQTFAYASATTTAGAQSQKKRVQCVEWALVRLVELWDPDEARSKLLPLFPPIDQAQSVALRAALLQVLEHAKKSGVLGRDILVRKTMLDECKGDRLEEVLAVFSSAVLKRVVAGGGFGEASRPALAQTLALENRGYAEEKTELAVLALAHKASLRKLLSEKAEACKRFADFSRLLDAQELGIKHRAERAKAAADNRREQGSGEDDAPQRVWRRVQNNWTGDKRWIEALRFGDAKATSAGLLGMPFGRVWRRVEAGRLGELEEEESRSTGLLEQLEGRVKTQQDRLEKWKAFQEYMQARASGARSSITQSREAPKKARVAKGIDLGFRLHDDGLQLARLSPRKASISAQPMGPLDGEYAEMLESLQDELAALRIGAANGLKLLLQPPAPAKTARWPPVAAEATSIKPEEEAPEEAIDTDDEPAPKPPKCATGLRHAVVSLRGSGRSSTAKQQEPAPSSSALPDSSSAGASPISPPRPPKQLTAPPDKATRRPPACKMASSTDALPCFGDSPAQPSPTQQLANEILASMENISPSPVKRRSHTRQLSLMDRTRLSMARTSTANHAKFTPVSLDDESFVGEESTMYTYADLDMAPASPCPPTTSRKRPEITEPSQTENDLVARTRRSMAGFEAAQQKARLDRLKSQRKEKEAQRAIVGTGRPTKESWFDKVAEEAAEQEREQDDAQEDTQDVSLLADELMTVQEDYDAIFRSRPRLKASPVASRMPSVVWRDDK